MDKRELLDKMETFSQQFMVTLAELDAIKRQVKEVFEENARLRLENTKLRDHLSHVVEATPEKTYTRGKEHLESIYDEGFHICNDFYGQHRGNDEDCVFCMGLLYRE